MDLKKICFMLVIALVSHHVFAYAEIKEIIAEGTYNMGDAESPLVAEKKALREAKVAAVEEAGIYIYSYLLLKNTKLVKHESQQLASGIMAVEILDKKREIVGESIRFWVKIRAKVSTDNIESMVERMRELKFADHYKSLQEDYEASKKEIKQLKKQMADVTEENEKTPLEIKIKDEERLFQANQWNSMGDKYLLNEEYDNAVLAYTSAIALIPSYTRSYILRGLVYNNKNSLNKAIKDYTKAIEINPTYIGNSDLYALRGKVYFKKDLLDRAIEDYTKAIEINPANQEAFLGRASAYNSKGQYNKAIDDSTLAIDLDHNSFRAYRVRYNQKWCLSS